MYNFSQRIYVTGEELDFHFSWMRYPGGERYLVVVTDGKKQVTNFYMEKTASGTWMLADKFKLVPQWVYDLQPLIRDAINHHYGRE